MSGVGTTLPPALAAGGFALIGLWLGSRGEKRRWLRETRRQAYMDYANAVFKIQAAMRGTTPGSSADPHANENMHRALTAVALVGPKEVTDATEPISEALRVVPIDATELDKRYNHFVRLAALVLSRGTWFGFQVRRAPRYPDVP